MSLNGYCKNGIHYVEDDDCWKCKLREQQNASAKVFYAAVDAHSLMDYMGGKDAV